MPSASRSFVTQRPNPELSPYFLQELRKFQAQLVWLKGLNAGPKTKGSPVQFSVRACVWVASWVPGGGVPERQPHIDVSLPVSPFLPLSLKINA